jgi:hypothetical protein
LISPRPIKEYALGIYDGPHATPREAAEGPLFLGIRNITDDGRLNLSEIRHVSEEDFPQWTRRVTPQPGDVVFTYEAILIPHQRLVKLLDEYVGPIFAQLENIRVQNEKLKQARDLLLPKLMSGEIAV